MNGKRGLLAGTATALIGWAAIAPAQPAPAEEGTVSGTGTVSLKRRPELLRVKVDIFARGKSMKEALANLKDRREAVRGQLATLGRGYGIVAFGEPRNSESLLEARNQMEMMIRSRLGNRGKKDPKKGPAPPSVVSVGLTAEWPLKGQDTETLLVEVAQLQEAITAADLAGKKELDKLSTDDEELAEEMEGVEAATMNDPGAAQPGTPIFSLISKITAQDQSKALSDAFRKAKSRANAIARAAGAELGPLRQLSSHIGSNPDSEDADDPRQAYLLMMQQAREVLPDESDDPLEALGSQPGAVSYRVTVVAAFALREGH